jgi:predicted transcriptional regulator
MIPVRGFADVYVSAMQTKPLNIATAPVNRYSKSTRQRQGQMSDIIPESRILNLTAQIVSAHVSNNALQADALPGLIQSVFQTLTSAGKDTVQPGRPQPAVPAKKSVFADYIVCLEDGKKLKMLKRHLKTSYNMTPEQYRERWELPASYPMVAPNYAAHRSSLAKKIGLGTKRAKAPAKPAAKTPVKAARTGRGRKPRAA